MVIIFVLHKHTVHMQWGECVKGFYFASQICEIKQSFVLGLFNLLSEEHRMVAKTVFSKPAKNK